MNVRQRSILPDRLRERPEIAVLLVIGIALMGVSVVRGWWKLIGAGSPEYMAIFQVALLIAIVAAIWISFRSPQRAPSSIASLGLLGLFLPLLFIAVLVLYDAPSITGAMDQADQAKGTWRSIAGKETPPLVAWDTHYGVVADGFARQDYTFLDQLETASFFTLAGWYMALIGGALVLCAGLSWDANCCRATLVRYAARTSIAMVIAIIALATAPAIGAWYRTKAREYYFNGRPTAALSAYRTAVLWDHRIDYDPQYHYELGLVYGALGAFDQPDYLATKADKYMSSGAMFDGLRIYQRLASNVDANPSMRRRYVGALLRMGAEDFANGRPSMALQRWNKAASVDPTNLMVVYFRGIGYTTCAQYGPAIECWQEVIRNNESVGLFSQKFFAGGVYRKPITSAAWRHLAWCYSRIGRNDLAMASWRYSKSLGATAKYVDDGGMGASYAIR